MRVPCNNVHREERLTAMRVPCNNVHRERLTAMRVRSHFSVFTVLFHFRSSTRRTSLSRSGTAQIQHITETAVQLQLATVQLQVATVQLQLAAVQLQLAAVQLQLATVQLPSEIRIFGAQFYGAILPSGLTPHGVKYICMESI